MKMEETLRRNKKRDFFSFLKSHDKWSIYFSKVPILLLLAFFISLGWQKIDKFFSRYICVCLYFLAVIFQMHMCMIWPKRCMSHWLMSCSWIYLMFPFFDLEQYIVACTLLPRNHKPLSFIFRANVIDGSCKRRHVACVNLIKCRIKNIFESCIKFCFDYSAYLVSFDKYVYIIFNTIKNGNCHTHIHDNFWLF